MSLSIVSALFIPVYAEVVLTTNTRDNLLINGTSSLSASWANYAGTASVLLGSIQSASLATSASYSNTSSWTLNVVSSSYSNTASFTITASYSLTASYVTGSNGVLNSLTASFISGSSLRLSGTGNPVASLNSKGAKTGLWIYENNATASGKDLGPCLLTLHAKNANIFYQLGYANDDYGFIANYMNSATNILSMLEFDFFDTVGNASSSVNLLGLPTPGMSLAIVNIPYITGLWQTGNSLNIGYTPDSQNSSSYSAITIGTGSYVAINGYQSPIIQAGSASISSATSKIISFNKAMPNISYTAFLTGESTITSPVVSGKTVNGFTASFSLYSGILDWQVVQATQ